MLNEPDHYERSTWLPDPEPDDCLDDDDPPTLLSQRCRFDSRGKERT